MLSESLQSSNEAGQLALDIIAKDGFAFYKSALLYDLQLADLLTDFVRETFPEKIEELNSAIVEIGASDYFRSMLEDDEQDKEIFDNMIAYDATIGEKIAQKIKEKDEAAQKIAKAFSGNKPSKDEENDVDDGYMTLGEFEAESPNSTMIIKSKTSLAKSKTNSIDGIDIEDRWWRHFHQKIAQINQRLLKPNCCAARCRCWTLAIPALSRNLVLCLHPQFPLKAGIASARSV